MVAEQYWCMELDGHLMAAHINFEGYIYGIHLFVMKHTSDSKNIISNSNVPNFPVYVTQGFKGSRG